MGARLRRSRVLPRAVLRPIVARLIVLVFLSCSFVAAQSDRAAISGCIADQSGAVLVAARVDITDVESGVGVSTLTSDDGVYVLTNLRPGPYRMTVQKEGFRTIVLSDLVLNVQDALSRNFTMQVGIASETITVTAGRDEQNMSAAVSTVVDSQFVQNMPLNGRSFQSLFYMTPGVIVATWATQNDPGQFSVNGQRTDANYFTIDGVSADFGVDYQKVSQSIGGTLPGFTALGGTNSLVSVDSMREFRILTSSYAPEYGRMPGAQISIVTKSGTNAWHGSAADYLRNDVFDARNYFDYKNPNNPSGADPLPKPALRQNDFGGTFSGPIWKDRTFFFVSYEGLRLLQPVLNSSYFLTSSEKANFTGGWAAIANATPTGPVALANKSNLATTQCGPTSSVPGQTTAPDDPNYTPCATLLTAQQSNPSSFNAYSIRVDHSLTNRINLFGGYNHTPSHQGLWSYNSLSDIVGNSDTVTAGVTAAISPTMVN